MNGKLDRRTLLVPLLLVIGLADALPFSAEPGVRITGSVQRSFSSLPPDLRIELVPLFPSRAAAERRLAGEVPEPLAVARPDAAGAFELLAPGPGFYRAIVRTEGWETRCLDLAPLLEPATLPPIAPSPKRKTNVARLVGPGGRPLAGVEVDLSLDSEERLLPGLWLAYHGSAVTDAEGRIELPAHLVRLRLHRPDLLGTVMTVADAGPAEVPRRRTRQLEVRAPEGDPVPSALVSWRSSPVGLTGPDGRIAVALPQPGEPPLFIEGPAGLSAEVVTGGAAADPIVVRLRPPVAVSGRVVDAASGQPIPAAWVWAEPLPFAAPGRTGPDGRFVLPLPPGWNGRLHAAAAGTVREEKGTPLALRGGTPANPAHPSSIELRLRAAAVGTGLVVDADGKGVAGALVRVITPGQPGYSHLRGPDAYAGTDGAFRLPGLLPDGSYELSVTHAGFAPQRAVLRTSPAGRPSRPHRIVLTRGQTVTGKVVDEDGRPLSGAGLALHSLSRLEEERVGVHALSDATGGFALRPVTPGTFLLNVEKAGFPPLIDDLVVPAGAAVLDLGTLRLERGAALAGLVVDELGKPVPGAEVRCYWETGAPRRDGTPSTVQPPTTSVFTDAEGGFRCEGLSRGSRIGLWAHHPHYVDERVPGLEPPLNEPIRVELTPARTLSGRVTGNDGKPVAGAILVWNPGQIEERSGGTDTDGRFWIPKLTPGVADLRVQAPAHRSRLLRGIRIPAAAHPDPLEIVLDEGEALEGRVTDRRGEPVAGAWVKVDARWEQSSDLPEEARGIEPLTTGPDGRFFLGGLAEGTYEVGAGRNPWQVTVETVVEVRSGTNAIELSLGPESEVSGRVQAQDGAPVAGAQVHLQSADPQVYGFSAVSAPDGSFYFPFVTPGRFQVEASRKGYTAASPPPELELAGDAVRNLEILLTRTDQAITGRLLGLEPAEMTGILIYASSPSQPGEYTGSLDGQGGYRIPDLGPGEWNLLAHTRNGRRAQGTVRLAPGVAQTSFDLDFTTGLSLSGRVLVDRQPLAGAVVRVTNPKIGEGTALTQSDGSFRVTGLSPGTYELEIRTASHTVRHSQPVTVEAGREVLVEIESGAVSGQVTSATGEPLNGATVTLPFVSIRGGHAGPGPSARTGIDGRFSLPQISPGRYAVLVTKEGFESAEAEVIVRAGGTSVLNAALAPLP